MKSIKLVLPVMILFVFALTANTQENVEKEKVFYDVEQMPEYPGGVEALKTFVASNVQYPEEAKKNGISGKVYISFVVDKSGKVTDVKVARSVESSLDREAIRVVEQMPAWKPGKKDGHVVNVGFTLPIQFSLNAEK